MLARVARVLAVRELLEQHAPDLHRRVVVRVVEVVACPAGRTCREARDRSGRAGRRGRAPRRTSCRPAVSWLESPCPCATVALRVHLARERDERVVEGVVAHRRELRAFGFAGDALGRRHVVRGGVGYPLEAEEVDLAEVEVHLVRLRLAGRTSTGTRRRGPRRPRTRRGSSCPAARLACRAVACSSQRPLDGVRRVGDVRRVGLRARPRASRRVLRDGALERRLEARPVLDGAVAGRDVRAPIARRRGSWARA